MSVTNITGDSIAWVQGAPGNAMFCYFFFRKISSASAEESNISRGESSGGPKYMVHVSGDGVELLKDGDWTHGPEH